MGNIMVTPAVLDFLIAQRVDTVFMSIHGRFRGRLMHEHSKNVRLRLAQYQQLQIPDVALRVAKDVVRGKVSNARAFLLKAARRRGRSEELVQTASRLAATVERLEQMNTPNQVPGCEGRASALYFEVFGKLLTTPDFTFTERRPRPP